jgi:tRNA threonylcarbamoyladenosine biosynthesis protein TsaE
MSARKDILQQLHTGVTTESADATRQLATEFAATLAPDTTLALHGDMGVGKTTFVQGLAEGLGVHEHVTSPTFSIYTVYRGEGLMLVHVDAYRLESAHQIEGLLLDEFLVSPWVLAIEWPEKIAGWIPANALHVTLSIVDGDKHHVKLQR